MQFSEANLIRSGDAFDKIIGIEKTFLGDAAGNTIEITAQLDVFGDGKILSPANKSVEPLTFTNVWPPFLQ